MLSSRPSLTLHLLRSPHSHSRKISDGAVKSQAFENILPFTKRFVTIHLYVKAMTNSVEWSARNIGSLVARLICPKAWSGHIYRDLAVTKVIRSWLRCVYIRVSNNRAPSMVNINPWVEAEAGDLNSKHHSLTRLKKTIKVDVTNHGHLKWRSQYWSGLSWWWSWRQYWRGAWSWGGVPLQGNSWTSGVGRRLIGCPSFSLIGCPSFQKSQPSGTLLPSMGGLS